MGQGLFISFYLLCHCLVVAKIKIYFKGGIWGLVVAVGMQMQNKATSKLSFGEGD